MSTAFIVIISFFCAAAASIVSRINYYQTPGNMTADINPDYDYR